MNSVSVLAAQCKECKGKGYTMFVLKDPRPDGYNSVDTRKCSACGGHGIDINAVLAKIMG